MLQELWGGGGPFRLCSIEELTSGNSERPVRGEKFRIGCELSRGGDPAPGLVVEAKRRLQGRARANK